MSLQEKLDRMHASVIERAPELAHIADSDTARLVASGIENRALRTGESAPDFELPDQEGRMVRLSRALESGPVVLSFFRGTWCPYCNLELRALQQVMEQMKSFDAMILAVSPQLPVHSIATADINRLAFPVLSDQGNHVARRYGLVFSLSEFVRPAYAAIKVDLPELNGDGSYELPIPATFVLDRQGTVRSAFVDADYKKRMEPRSILESLSELSESRSLPE